LQIQVGTFNRTGSRYQGSFDIWTRNRISHLLDMTSGKFTSVPPNFGPGGWVNGNQYVQSKEVFGILPLPEISRRSLGMLVYHPDFAKEKKIRHNYLATKQNARFAILPIHTKEERALFRLLIADLNGFFAGKKEPDWQAVAARWSSHADGISIFYKV